MPPCALMCSSARSKPAFHCAPYCAFCPVSGPLTPNHTGSPVAGAASADSGAASKAMESAATWRRKRWRVSVGMVSDPEVKELRGRQGSW